MPQSLADSMRGSRAPWVPLMSGDVTSSDPTFPAATATKPATKVFSTGNFRTAKFVFAGTHGSAPDGKTINYRVIGWQQYKRLDSPGGTFWMPRVLAYGTATLGTAVVGNAVVDFAAVGAHWADGISDSQSVAGTVVHNLTDNTVGWLEVAVGNNDLIEVQVWIGTAVAMSVMYQLGDGIW